MADQGQFCASHFIPEAGALVLFLLRPDLSENNICVLYDSDEYQLLDTIIVKNAVI